MKHEKISEKFFVSKKSESDFLGCPKCEKGELIDVSDIVNNLGGVIFIVKGRRCSACSEEFIGEEEGQKMIQQAKKLGVWGIQMKLHRKLSKSARGTVLRIPSDIEKELKIKGTEEVLISRVGDNKLLIEIE